MSTTVNITTPSDQRDRQWRWDLRHLAMAQLVSTYSKDPSTKIGAVIVDPSNRVVSTGYNGFPRFVPDNPDHLNNREEKYPRVVHAEVNAILAAARPLEDHTIYVWPPSPGCPTCDRCAAQIIQAGISRVVGVLPPDEDGDDGWSSRIGNKIAVDMYWESGTQLDMVYLSHPPLLSMLDDEDIRAYLERERGDE